MFKIFCLSSLYSGNFFLTYFEFTNFLSMSIILLNQSIKFLTLICFKFWNNHLTIEIFFLQSSKKLKFINYLPEYNKNFCLNSNTARGSGIWDYFNSVSSLRWFEIKHQFVEELNYTLLTQVFPVALREFQYDCLDSKTLSYFFQNKPMLLKREWQQTPAIFRFPPFKSWPCNFSQPC